MLSLRLHMPDVTLIGSSCYGFYSRDGRTVYFANLEPYDFHDENDRLGRLLRIARLATHGVRSKDLEEAFNTSRATVHRLRKVIEEEGEAHFFAPRPGRSPSAIDAETAKKAVELLRWGKSCQMVALELGISPTTLNYNLRQGFLGEDVPGRVNPHKQEAIGTAEWARRMGRVPTSTGAMQEVAPAFERQFSAVACGGILTALPMLLREGLPNRADPFPSLQKGLYSLNNVLLLLAFLFMARIRNPEGLHHPPPGEWGAVLGLDRAPEVKTLRRILRSLSSDEEWLRNWERALANDRLTQFEDADATLAVDGHIKVYSGCNSQYPKRFESRHTLCLPTSTRYWINALGSRPLLCVNRNLDHELIQELEQDILPELERSGLLGADAPALAAERAVEPVLTLVFDREGWNPDLFDRLARRGIAVITSHERSQGENWPEAEFETIQVPHDGAGTSHTMELRLAEKRVRLPGNLEVRQIVFLQDNGPPVPVVTTDFCTSKEQFASALFSKGPQDNFFHCMRTDFNLWEFPVHGLDEQNPEAKVINPAWRELDLRLRKLINTTNTRRIQLDRLLHGTPKRTVQYTVQRLRDEIAQLETGIATLRPQKKKTAKWIRAAELDGEDRLDLLPQGEKLLLDIIRMSAYRAESRMMSVATVAHGKNPKNRPSLTALFRSDADIIPDHKNQELRVRILGTAGNSGDGAIEALLRALNETGTTFPGTNLRMVYELPGNGARQPATAP